MSRARGAAARVQGAGKPRARLRQLSPSKKGRANSAPRDGKEEGPRGRIHGSALTLFGRYGYDGVSLQMIADDVGLHKSSLFHHYSSKSELMDEVADGVVERLLELLGPLLSEERPSLEALYAAVERLVDHFSDHPAEARLLVTIMTAPDDSEIRRLASGDRSLRFYVGLARWLDRARQASVIRNLSIRQAIPNFMGLLLFYPAVANDLRDLVGADAFGPRARQVRKQELIRLARALFAPDGKG